MIDVANTGINDSSVNALSRQFIAPHWEMEGDVALLFEACRTISGEMVLDRLLETTLKILVERIGVRRASLVLEEQERLVVSSAIETGADVLCLQSAAIEESQEPARSIVHYVHRTRECVVLGNADTVGAFSRDPNVLANKPKPILCMPATRQDKALVILYLERDADDAAFTPGHLQALGLLASQLAISIGNARTLKDVERQMDERTYELNEKSELLIIAKEVLEEANDEMAREIEQRKLLEEELRRLSTTDSLTGLFIRRHMFELGEKEISRAKRNGTPMALLVLDIDHFKSINDTYGHQGGDEVLKNFAAIFRDSLRDIDIVCRFGGEEFVAILVGAPSQPALEVAERLRQNVADSVLVVEGKEIRYTVSIGLTCLSGQDGLVDQLISRADEALYQAKRSGRNRVVVAPDAGTLLEQASLA